MPAVSRSRTAASTSRFGKSRPTGSGSVVLISGIPTCLSLPHSGRNRSDTSILDLLKSPSPITAFNSFTDGLDPNRRSREHFITNPSLEDERLWVPYSNGVWFHRCYFNLTSGGFSVILKGLPGSIVGTHYHVGTVHGYTMRGHWRYLEHDWIAKPGTYIYEPAGEAHTLVITDDSPEPMVTLFVVGGGLIYLDKAVNGGFAAYEDGFTLLELTRKYYREAGLDARQLDLLVR